MNFLIPTRRLWLTLFLLFIPVLFVSVAVHSASAQSQKSQSGYIVRAVYLVPSDRAPQPDYEVRVRNLMKGIQVYFADQMEAHGLGRTTFTFDSHVLMRRLPLPSERYANPNTLTGSDFAGHKQLNYHDTLTGAGIDLSIPGVVWVGFVDTSPVWKDGSKVRIRGNASYYSTGGACVIGAGALNLFDPKKLDAHGHVILEAVQQTALAAGRTKDEIGGALAGAAHEVGHALGMMHCYGAGSVVEGHAVPNGGNDSTPTGYLMGGGLDIASRGYLWPDVYPDNDLVLDRANALMLKLVPWCRSSSEIVPQGPPVSIRFQTPPGAMQLDHGQVTLSFEAVQEGGPGIALAALLAGEGARRAIVAYKALPDNPHRVTVSFTTGRIPMTKDPNQIWVVRLIDAGGRVTQKALVLRRPESGWITSEPAIEIPHWRVKTNVPVHMRAASGLSPGCVLTWDFGDHSPITEGVFATHTYARAGQYEVTLTVRHEDRIATISRFVSVTDEGLIPPIKRLDK